MFEMGMACLEGGTWIYVWVVDMRKSWGLQQFRAIYMETYDQGLDRKKKKRLSFFALHAAGILMCDRIQKCAASFGYTLNI